MWLESGARGWKSIFDIAKLLKTTVHPLRVRFQNRHSFSTHCELETILRKLNDSFILLLHDKSVTKILIALLHRSVHLLRHTATRNPFRAPTTTISHFAKFGFSLEKEKKIIISTSFSMIVLFKKGCIICICSIKEAELRDFFNFYFGMFFN